MKLRCVQTHRFTIIGLEYRWARYESLAEVMVVVGTFKGISNTRPAWGLWGDLWCYLNMVSHRNWQQTSQYAKKTFTHTQKKCKEWFSQWAASSVESMHDYWTLASYTNLLVSNIFNRRTKANGRNSIRLHFQRHSRITRHRIQKLNYYYLNHYLILTAAGEPEARTFKWRF